MSHPLRHFWEGQDSTGRELRAYLITDASAHDCVTTNRVALDTELPAIEFRSPKKWALDAEEREWKQALRESLAYARARHGKPPPPVTPMSGTTWVRVATVSLREAGECRRLGMSMGVANGSRNPGLLSLDRLAELFFAADQWVESAGTKSVAKVLREAADGR